MVDDVGGYDGMTNAGVAAGADCGGGRSVDRGVGAAAQPPFCTCRRSRFASHSAFAIRQPLPESPASQETMPAEIIPPYTLEPRIGAEAPMVGTISRIKAIRIRNLQRCRPVGSMPSLTPVLSSAATQRASSEHRNTKGERRQPTSLPNPRVVTDAGVARRGGAAAEPNI